MDVNQIPASQTYAIAAAQELADIGRKVSDHLNMVRLFHDWDDIKDKWMAFRLSDGGTDGVVYETRKDAVSYQFHEQWCAYISFANLVGGAVPRECAIFMKFTRDAYKGGMRLVDPEAPNGGREAVMTTAMTDYYRAQLGL